MTDKVWAPPESNLVPQLSFIGVAYRSMGENDSITKAHPSVSDSSQSWEAGAHCSACRQLNKLGVPPPGVSVGPDLLAKAQLGLLLLAVSMATVFAAWLVRERPSDSGEF